MPVLLGGVFKATGNRSPMEAFAGIPAKLAYEALETRRFVARHGLTRFRPNPHFPVNTLAIMRGAEAARDLDVFARLCRGGVRGHVGGRSQDGRSGGDRRDPRRRRAAGRATDGDDAGPGGEGPADGQHHAAPSSAGVFGSPSFFVGDELYFGKDRLRDVEEALAR